MKKALIIIVALVVVAGGVLVATRDRGSAKESVEIGILLPLTGPAANHGQDSLNAIRLRMDQIEASGGPAISLAVEDSQSNPTQALNAFQKLTDINKVPVVIGPISSSIVLGLASVANERHVPIIAIGSSAPKITEAGPYVYRHALLAETQSAELARYAWNTLGATNVAFFYMNDDTGLGYANRFREVYEQLGGVISEVETFDRDSRDFRTQLTKLKASGAPVVFSPGIPSSTGYLLKQSAELGYLCTVLAGYGVEGQDIITIAGNEGRRLIYTSMPYDQAFLEAYQERYNKAATAGAGLAYDAMGLLAKAVSDGVRTAEDFKRFLDTTRGFQGATGILEFDANGDTQKSPLVLKTVSAGEFISLAPHGEQGIPGGE